MRWMSALLFISWLLALGLLPRAEVVADPFAKVSRTSPPLLAGLVRVSDRGIAFFRIGAVVRAVRPGEAVVGYRLIRVDDRGVVLARAGKSIRISYGGGVQQ